MRISLLILARLAGLGTASPGRRGRDGVHHRRRADGALVERAPAVCPAGHPLGPSCCLIGNHPCLCAGQSHRTWRCRECDACWVWPPCRERPEWPAWSGG